MSLDAVPLHKRTFETGANRDTDIGKPDPEAYLSVPAMRAYIGYMQKHTRLADGTVRDGDNWQKGWPAEVSMKSLFRHFMDVWDIHRGGIPLDYDGVTEIEMADALCGVLFNAFALLHLEMQ